MLRKVEIYEWKWDKEFKKSEKVTTGRKGLFHEWGLEAIEDRERGNVSYTVALVELSDGTVEMIPVGLIVFIT